jgi:ankyrin repeat protein
MRRTGGIRLWIPALALLALGAAGCGESIHDLAARGDTEAVAAKLEENPELIEAPNTTGKARGKTPLFFAVTSRNPEVVAFLLEAGAHVHAHDDTGMTPLHAAAMWNRVQEVTLLVEAGANADARDMYAMTPLHLAAMWNRVPAIDALAGAGADLNALSTRGETPLDAALRERKAEAARRLRELGARAEAYGDVAQAGN